MSWYRTPVAVALIPGILAFAARLYGLSEKPLWLDEVITHVRANLPISNLIASSLHNKHFPTYFFLASAFDACRFRKLHPFDSRSPANQNMIAGCSQLPSFSSACCATVSSRDDGLKPRSWCCGINSTSCSSARHIGYV
jgi:hypothetical protein